MMLDLVITAFIAVSNFVITHHTIENQTCLRRVFLLIWVVVGAVIYSLPLIYKAVNILPYGLMEIISNNQTYLLLIIITYLANAFLKEER